MKKIRKPFVFLLVMLPFFCACGNAHTQRLEESQNTYAEDIQYDFSEQAAAYLHILGTEFPDRELLSAEGNTDEKTRQEFTEWLLAELKAAGYSDENIALDRFSVYGDDSLQGQNIVVTLPGKNSAKQVIVGAHYDGNGVGDNASGVALLLANACGLAQEEPDTTVKFIFFDAEELGELGSSHYVETMSAQERKNTIYMINMDSLAFGDYCCVYGGEVGLLGNLIRTSGYEAAMDRAEQLGVQTYRTEDLDGYYAEHETGPEPASNTLYTNPWTTKNPSPLNFDYPSPTTGGWGDQAPFSDKGVVYIYLEATNWYAQGDGGEWAYTGYFDTDAADIGYYGMFMNTSYDTLDVLEQYFPGRVQEHFALFGPLMASLVLHPAGA